MSADTEWWAEQGRLHEQKTRPLPAIGSLVTLGRTNYRVIRHGCASGWDKCPHGDRAITVERIGKGHGTECLAAV